MKKLLTLLIIVVTAIVSVSFKNEEVRKLPSKIMFYVENDIWSLWEYFYDEQNRLIKIATSTENLDIIYDADGLPLKMKSMVSENIFNIGVTYQNNGKKIIIQQDTLWLNDKGQFTNARISIFDGINTSYFTYNSNEDIIKKSEGYEVNLTFSDIPSMWRHVNTPEWFLAWLGFKRGVIFPLEKNGYLVSQQQILDNEPVLYIYELDTDNYVTRMQSIGAFKMADRPKPSIRFVNLDGEEIEWIEPTEPFWKYEYILAR